ncbi:MAG TPA: hypothetical protein VD907_05065 [Verrucomicrobiae bacterium]|nr:hypothetical protein [Verrucomicrobiae bacterium]
MDQIALLIKRLRQDYPGVTFTESDVFKWRPDERTVYFIPQSSSPNLAYLLHETAHAILNHQEYILDIDLIKMERAAWHYAQTTLSSRYGLSIVESLVNESLDSYRDWLHQRSLCPSCSTNGLQNINGTYSCHLCAITWRANEAHFCALRRQVIN